MALEERGAQNVLIRSAPCTATGEFAVNDDDRNAQSKQDLAAAAKERKSAIWVLVHRMPSYDCSQVAI